jgi:hypothetical protein
VFEDRLEFGAHLDGNELALRVMARENRFARRILGKSLREFCDLASTGELRSRFVRSLSGVVYVFLARPHGYSRELRTAELGQRCYVVRGLHPDSTTVIGLATEQYAAGKGFSFDLAYLHYPEWTDANRDLVARMQAELGYFKQPRQTPLSEDEYPVQPDGPSGRGRRVLVRAAARGGPGGARGFHGAVTGVTGVTRGRN